MLKTAPTPVRKVLFTDEFVQDPYPAYRRMLEEGSLHFVDIGGGARGEFGPSSATRTALVC